MIDFLDELGNFKQKDFYSSKCKFFLHFKAKNPMYIDHEKISFTHILLRYFSKLVTPSMYSTGVQLVNRNLTTQIRHSKAF